MARINDVLLASALTGALALGGPAAFAHGSSHYTMRENATEMRMPDLSGNSAFRDSDRERHEHRESIERQQRIETELATLNQRLAQVTHEIRVLYRLGSAGSPEGLRLRRESMELQEKLTRLQNEQNRAL